MNILKRQLALLLVLAMTLTMLPMPTHADEVTDPESPSAIVEESTEKPTVSKDEVSTDAAKKPVEKAESDTAAKEDAAPAVETPVDTAVNSNTTTTDELIPDVSEDTPASDPVEKPEAATDADDTAEDAEVEENTESGSTVESEEDSTAADNIESDIPEASKTDTQEGTDQVESETDVLVASTFSFSRSVANAVADECEHLETEVAWDTKDQVINCKPISDTQHQISGYQYRYCTSCYKRVGESFAAEELEDHSLDADGKCSLCGHGSGSDCSHANTETAWDTDHSMTYNKVSDTQHNVVGYQYTYCTNCFQRIGDSVFAWEPEDHSIASNGKCSLCGYDSKCTHEKTSVVTDIKVEGYKWLSDTKHVALVKEYDCCINCDVIVGEWRLVEFKYSDDHTLDARGMCKYCQPCSHETKITDWNPNQLTRPSYSQHDAFQHLTKGYQYTYCASCNEQFSTDFWAEKLEDHTLNASGVCTLCGYGYEPPCNHLRDPDSGEVSYTDPPRYEQCNEETHYIYRPTYYSCIYCGDPMEEPGYTISNEPHVPENGVCIHCGFNVGEDYCAHSEKDVAWDTNQTITYNKYNDTHHKVTGYQYTYCTSCFERVGESFATEEYEEHSLNTSGKCSLCGYSTGTDCSHINFEIVCDEEKPITHEQYSGFYHITYFYQYSRCKDCHTRLSESYPTDEWMQHSLDDDNICKDCGYAAPVIEDLQIFLTLSQSTVQIGDTVQAVASVTGGSGNYYFTWIVSNTDGYIMYRTDYAENSCDFTPRSEGSYVFQATAYDSQHRDLWAQAVNNVIVVEKIACSHENTETVTSTQLVNQSLTHHTVETTTYEECTICHEKRNEVTDVEWVEHTPTDAESYGHEAAHPHKKYFICECGSHPYLDGEYHTANGEVQDESVCCICNGHKYGAEEETLDGTRQKTCANCGIITVTHTHNFEPIETEKLINPDETKHERETTTYEKCKICGHEKPGITVTIDEPHSPKNPDDYKFRDGHPHLRYAVCECGKEFDMQDEYKTANGTMQAPDVCCLCHGHVFGEPTEINAVIWKRICSVCGYEDRIAAPSQTETEATEPPANTNEKQELKDYNIDFIKKNALGKNDIYTLFFNDELRAEIEELSEGNAAKGYDFIDGDPAAHLGYAQADYYVDTLMKQCAELDPDSDTIRVSPGELKAICKIIGLEDTVIEAILKEWVWDDRDGCIMEADEFKDKLDQYKDDTGATLLDGLGKVVDIGTFIWDCLSDISVYNAALDGSASAMIDAAVVHMKNSGIDQAQTAAKYIEDLKDPEKRITYIIMKNAGIAEKVRDTITGATGSIPAWDIAFEAATLLNGGLFRTNDVIKSNHGTYWSLQLVDELYRNLESSIAQYENISSDKNYTACMDAYSLYITYLISSYNGVLETRENYSSSLVAQLITDKDVKEKEKALNEQYKAIMEWYEFDISAAINDFSIDQVVESIRDN